MRTICDVCESAVAVLFCAADEAALCRPCDEKVRLSDSPLIMPYSHYPSSRTTRPLSRSKTHPRWLGRSIRNRDRPDRSTYVCVRMADLRAISRPLTSPVVYFMLVLDVSSQRRPREIMVF
jgi:hypothetical protein